MEVLALSPSKAIFRARTYSPITLNLFRFAVDDFLMTETRRKPTTGTRCLTVFDKCHRILYMTSRTYTGGLDWWTYQAL